MLTRRPRIYHSGKTFQERLFAHRIAVEQGALIFGFSNHVFSSIRREFLALLKDTRESLDLDRRFRRIEKLRELDEAVDYLSEQKYREAVERQRRPEPKPTQSRTPAEPAFLRIVKPGAGLMIPPFCHTCLGTGTLYHTEKEPAGWVAFFEPCPLCRPNETAAFPGRLRQVSTGRGAAS